MCPVAYDFREDVEPVLEFRDIVGAKNFAKIGVVDSPSERRFAQALDPVVRLLRVDIYDGLWVAEQVVVLFSCLEHHPDVLRIVLDEPVPYFIVDKKIVCSYKGLVNCQFLDDVSVFCQNLDFRRQMGCDFGLPRGQVLHGSRIVEVEVDSQ